MVTENTNPPAQENKKEKKSLIKQLWAFFTRKDVVFIFLGFFFSILFYAPLKAFSIKYLLTPWLAQVPSNKFTDALVLILGLGIVGYYIPKIKKRFIPSYNGFLVIVLAFILYVISRTALSDEWEFIRFSFLPSVAYFDIFFFSVFVLESWLVKLSLAPTRQGTEPATNQGFIIDQPIELPEEDALKRTAYAQSIAAHIKGTSSESSFAIGLAGPWGSGKTSFMYIIKHALGYKHSESKDIFIDFNPWNSLGPDKIVEDFFATMEQALSPYSHKFSRRIRAYTQKLVEVDSTLFTRVLSSFSQWVSPDSGSLADNKAKINDTLAKLGRRLYVCIDDLDRLDKKELTEVIRLVRNIADFKHTIFFVAYDKPYLVAALKEINDYQPEKYLEKIFLVEFDLTKITEKYHLLNLFENGIRPLLNGQEDWSELNIQNWINVEDFNLIFKSYREVIQFVNMIKPKVNAIKDEIIIQDLIYLEIIKLKSPQVYNELYHNINYYLDIPVVHLGNIYFKVINISI